MNIEKGITLQMLGVFVLLASFGSGIFFLNKHFISCSTSTHPDSTWVSTVGEVTETGWVKKGHTTKIRYVYNATVYEEKTKSTDVHSFYAKGSKYRILVNPKKGTEFVLRQWSPVFEEYLLTDSTIGTISRILDVSSSSSCSDSNSSLCMKFSYNVGTAVYEFAQDVAPDHPNASQIKVGQQYRVVFVVSNPQRSIIYFDKPVKR